jgi:hypothetical protein
MDRAEAQIGSVAWSRHDTLPPEAVILIAQAVPAVLGYAPSTNLLGRRRTMLPDPPRKPLDATLSRTNLPIERRGNRLAPTRCGACGRAELSVMLRTDYVVYFRCEHCAQVWSIAKPGEQFGT